MESATLNLAQRSFNVITVWRQSISRVRLYIAGVRAPPNINFRSVFNRFGDFAGFIPQNQLRK